MQEKYGFDAFILPAVLHRYACVQEYFMISIYMLFHKFVFVEFYKLILRDLSLYLYILYLVALTCSSATLVVEINFCTLEILLDFLH